MDSLSPLNQENSPFSQVPVEVTVAVGKAHPRIKELLTLAPNSVLTLDKSVDDPVELYVGKKLIARGVLEEVEASGPGRLAVRLTEVAQPETLT